MRPLYPLTLILAALLVTGCGRALLEDRAERDRTLYLASARIRGFDPAKVSDVASAKAIALVYETLVQIAYLERPYRVEPLLADGMPETSPDGLRYTFKLRKGIHFSDDPCFPGGRGREMTADDVVYSIKRLADRKVASSGWWAFEGRIRGLDEFRAASGGPGPTDYNRPVEGLRAIDRYTVEFTLTKPFPQFLWVLALHYASIVPREAVEYYGDRFAARPVGSGPYRLIEWRRNYRKIFERNPKWAETGRVDRYPSRGEPGDEQAGLLADAGKPLPLIDRIVMYVIADSTTQWMMFLRGELDESDISRDNWSVVIGPDGNLLPELAARGIRLTVSPQLRINYIGFNMNDPVVGPNRALRLALTCAFNSEEWIRLHNGRVRRARGPIPSTLAGYEPDYDPYPFNLERARAYLVEAGYPGGRDPATGRRVELTLELGRADDPELRQAAELIAAFFDRIGVALRLSFNNGPAFFEKLERGQAQMFYVGWLGDYPDAENFLQCLYGPNSDGGPNRAHYRSSEFDRLFEQVRVMEDSPERTALYSRLARIAMDDAPWIFVAEPLSYTLHQSRLRNRKPHLFPYGVEKYYGLSSDPR
ncbi:MAG: ABC transporter substrate-binding protein [Kiritimatiellae bacterium]|nr:ABC transporter substrate-binding protein [Kiritimatiellia bacterium]MDW8459095.1 ABC transporter substrate-binding protein [Verrucomicrobiota bacterium]